MKGERRPDAHIGTLKAERIGSYDIIVAGGGPAGFAAAIAAAREGARVLLVESQGCLGGVATSAAVAVYLGHARRQEDALEWAVGGIFREVYDRLLARNGCCEVGKDVGGLGLSAHILFDIEALKLLQDEMIQEADVDLLYFTTALAPESEPDAAGRRIDGLYLVNKNGLSYVEGKAIIDCTGDADIAYRAGFDTVKGRSDTGLMTAATLIYMVENVSPEPIAEYLESGGDRRFRPLVQELKAKGVWKWDEETIIVVPTNTRGIYLLNTNRQIGTDGTDAGSLTRAAIAGRRNAQEFMETVLRPHYPGFKNARLRFTAPMVGIRETRKIVGEYTLTDTDMVEGREFGDTIALSAYGFDLPDPKRPSLQIYSKEFWGREVRIRDGVSRIPYRSLLPAGSENLLVAGRCLSVEDMALGPVRVMPPCYAMGQAAGVAAAMSARNGCRPNQVDVARLRTRLRAGEAILSVDDMVTC